MQWVLSNFSRRFSRVGFLFSYKHWLSSSRRYSGSSIPSLHQICVVHTSWLRLLLQVVGCRVIIIDKVCSLGWLIIRVGHLSKCGYSDLLVCNLLRYVGKLRPHARRDQSMLGGCTFRPSVFEEGRAVGCV